MKYINRISGSIVGIAIFFVALVIVPAIAATPKREGKTIKNDFSTTTFKARLAERRRNILATSGRVMGTIASVKDNGFTVKISTNGTFLGTKGRVKAKNPKTISITTNPETKIQSPDEKNKNLAIGDSVMVMGEMSTTTNRFVAMRIMVLPNNKNFKEKIIKNSK